MIRPSTFVLSIAFVISACTHLKHETTVEKLSLPETQVRCVAAGGDWVAPGPDKIISGCLLLTKDGGKKCVTSADCQGKCVEHQDGNRCAVSVSGCFEETGRDTVTQCVN